MGDIYKSSYTTEIPEGATVKGNIVSWKDKRKKSRTGQLVIGKGGVKRVVIEGSFWLCRYRDESGRTVKISTGCKTKDAAQRFLQAKELEVERIKSGVISREEIQRIHAVQQSIQSHLDIFDAGRKAGAITPLQISIVRSKLEAMFQYLGIKSLDEITIEQMNRYIIYRMESVANQTINHDIDAIKSFGKWCHETGRLPSNPVTKLKKLPMAGNRTERRAFTDDELVRLFDAVDHRPFRGKDFREERKLIYETYLGTGFRSTELATVRVHQVELNSIVLAAPSEKNRKGTRQPILATLGQKLLDWIKQKKKKPQDFLFTFNHESIKDHFDRDIAFAGIPKTDDRGHVLVVHSFRHTFGTQLARAGVPLTTTQRLMRHSSPELTAKYYIDVTPIDMILALEKAKGCVNAP